MMDPFSKYGNHWKSSALALSKTGLTDHLEHRKVDHLQQRITWSTMGSLRAPKKWITQSNRESYLSGNAWGPVRWGGVRW